MNETQDDSLDLFPLIAAAEPCQEKLLLSIQDEREYIDMDRDD